MKNLLHKLRTTIVLVFIISQSAYTQTPVNGYISSNTIWNQAASPYIVTGNILVSYGYRLTIDAGVVVKFDRDCAIQVDGEMIAVGTELNRITFTSNQTSPLAGDWAKIQFSDSSTDAVFDTSGNYLSGSILKFCDIQYAGGLGYGAFHNIGAYPYFNNCKILDCESSGFYIIGGDLNSSSSPLSVIDSCCIRNCQDYGIYSHYNEARMFIQNDTIENCKGGLQFSGLDNVLISNNYIASNYGAITCRFMSMFQLTISVNDFVNNEGDNIISHSSSGFSGNFYVDCNRFINNHSTSDLYKASHAHGSISSNVFDGNESTYGSIVGLSNDVSVHFMITNNIFRNNRTLNVPCLSFALIPYLIFENNSLLNNEALCAVGLRNFGGTSFRNNNFDNPNSTYELYNMNAYGEDNIDASNNYWGSSNAQHIDTVIYDFFDNANLSVASFTPFLTSAAIVDTSCNSIPSGFDFPQAAGPEGVIFPNPAMSYCKIQLTKMIVDGSLEVFDILGNKVLYEHMRFQSTFDINLQKFIAGLYIVKITDGQRSLNLKLVVR